MATKKVEHGLSNMKQGGFCHPSKELDLEPHLETIMHSFHSACIEHSKRVSELVHESILSEVKTIRKNWGLGSRQ